MPSRKSVNLGPFDGIDLTQGMLADRLRMQDCIGMIDAEGFLGGPPTTVAEKSGLPDLGNYHDAGGLCSVIDASGQRQFYAVHRTAADQTFTTTSGQSVTLKYLKPDTPPGCDPTNGTRVVGMAVLGRTPCALIRHFCNGQTYGDLWLHVFDGRHPTWVQDPYAPGSFVDPRGASSTPVLAAAGVVWRAINSNAYLPYANTWHLPVPLVSAAGCLWCMGPDGVLRRSGVSNPRRWNTWKPSEIENNGEEWYIVTPPMNQGDSLTLGIDTDIYNVPASWPSGTNWVDTVTVRNYWRPLTPGGTIAPDVWTAIGTANAFGNITVGTFAQVTQSDGTKTITISITATTWTNGQRAILKVILKPLAFSAGWTAAQKESYNSMMTTLRAKWARMAGAGDAAWFDVSSGQNGAGDVRALVPLKNRMAVIYRDSTALMAIDPDPTQCRILDWTGRGATVRSGACVSDAAFSVSGLLNYDAPDTANPLTHDPPRVLCLAMSDLDQSATAQEVTAGKVNASGNGHLSLVDVRYVVPWPARNAVLFMGTTQMLCASRRTDGTWCWTRWTHNLFASLTGEYFAHTLIGDDVWIRIDDRLCRVRGDAVASTPTFVTEESPLGSRNKKKLRAVDVVATGATTVDFLLPRILAGADAQAAYQVQFSGFGLMSPRHQRRPAAGGFRSLSVRLTSGPSRLERLTFWYDEMDQ